MFASGCVWNAIRRFVDSRRSNSIPQEFVLHPDFFSVSEQRILLSAALRKLDSLESRQAKRRRKTYLPSNSTTETVEGIFLPDEYYSFEKGHYDNVIHSFREMHVTSWPEAEVAGLPEILSRLRGLYPTPDTQTHLVHLSSTGEILPHVDNIMASGSWILGASLGGERIMRIESSSEDDEAFNVLLPSGSVYIQKDKVRFEYKHSVLSGGTFRGREIKHTQRVSIMVRDKKAIEMQS